MVRVRPGAALALVTAAVVVWWLWDLYRLPAMADLAAYWQLVVAVVALAVALVPLVQARRQAGECADEDARDAHLADQLADAVGEQWASAAAERGLLHPNPIPVRWTRPTKAVTGPVDAAVDSGRFGRLPGTTLVHRDLLGSGDVVNDLHDVYAGPGSGRVVIVGAPGSGKSGAAVLLVLRALAHRAGVAEADRHGVPVPVLFTLQSWNPDDESLRDWLTGQLRRTYVGIFTGRGTGKQIVSLLNRGRIAVVLDGLDEIDHELRPVVVAALDKQATTFRLVVLSRTAEMATAADHRVLRGAAAIELYDVPPADAADYLRRAWEDPPSEARRELLRTLRLKPSGPLARALRNPLTLSLLRDTFGPQDRVDTLLAPTASGEPVSPATVETRLLERVIPTAYQHQPGRPPYSPEYAQRALRLLARRSGPGGTLEWWQVPTWTAAGPRALVVGLLAGAASWVVLLPVASVVSAPFLSMGLGAILGAWSASTPRLPDSARDSRRWPTLLSHPLPLLACGVVVGITVMMAMFFLAITSPAMIAVAILLWRAAVVALVVGGIGRWAIGRARRPSAPGAPVVPPPPAWQLLSGGIALGYVLQGSGVLFLGGWWSIVTLLVGILVLVAGLAFGFGFSGPSSSEVMTPYGSWRAYRWGALAMWLALAAFAGGLQSVLGFGESLGLQPEAAFLIQNTIVAGLWLAFGFLLGVVFPESWTASLSFVQLAVRTGFRSPPRLMRFLEDAREREVMRTIGPAYQFRHEHLREHLATQSPPRAPARRPLAAHARAVLRSVTGALRHHSATVASGRAGSVMTSAAVGAVTATAYWLGQAFVYPGLWGTRIGAATALAAGLGAAVGARPRRTGLDESGVRWALLLRHPGLVLGLAVVLTFNLAADVGRSSAVVFSLNDATLGLPFAVAVWLVFGLGAAVVRTRRSRQLLQTWRGVHENLPLVFVVGLGLGWIAEAHVVATLPGTEVIVRGEVVTAGARNGFIGSIATGAVALGFLLILALASPKARESDTGSASAFTDPGRATRLVLWAVVGSLLANLLTRDVIRAYYLAGAESRTGAWLVTLVLTLLPGYVVGLMFPRGRPPDAGRAAPRRRTADQDVVIL